MADPSRQDCLESIEVLSGYRDRLVTDVKAMGQRLKLPQKQIEATLASHAELQRILDLYGRMVAAGEWRDYAIDFTPHKAIFSIYRRSSEVPLFRIEKDPKLAQKQGAYSVITPTGLILKRGHDLSRVLAVLDRPVKLIYG